MTIRGATPEALTARARKPNGDRRHHPFFQFAVVGALGMMAIGLASLIASRRAGEAEAMAEVRELTQVVGTTLLRPNITPGLIEGDPRAVTAFDQLVTTLVMDDSTVRVKLWAADGRVVYSDETRLIGETYELDDDKLESLWSGSVVSEISSLEGPENRFEQDQGQLLEVYLPIHGPDGTPLLYESYFAMSEVTESSGRIRSAFAPIILGSLAVTETMHLALAWGLSRRLRRGQKERERLLRRAVDSSDLERRRIAADIHDGVVQDLVGTSLTISAAAETAAQESSVLAEDLRSAAIGTRKSLTSLRSLLVDIYPPNLETQGLEVAVLDLLAVPSSMGIETDLVVEGEIDRSLDAAALTYRVVQEAVRNAVRHASPNTLSIRIEATTQDIDAHVVDDGRGFDPELPRGEEHLGLRFLADLVTDAGATLDVESEPGMGTTVRLRVPK